MRALMLAVAASLAAQVVEFPAREWPSEPPPDCPFQRSNTIAGVKFLGRAVRYANADTWYPSWASDDNLYSPWTDGSVGSLRADSNGTADPARAVTGHATIVGDDPLHLEIRNAGVYPGNPRPYEGRYPSASL